MDPGHVGLLCHPSSTRWSHAPLPGGLPCDSPRVCTHPGSALCWQMDVESLVLC